MQDSITSQLTIYEELLILKNFSTATRSMYLRTLKSFLRFCKRKFPRDPLSQDLARQYILVRHKQGRSWSTINCDYSSLRKYFKEVLEIDWFLKKMPRPKKGRSLPQILSQQDVIKLINCAATYKHQVFICFVYVTGLRLSEACNVTFADIDRNRLQIRVRKGKGAKDRYIQIPETLIEILTSYYERMKPENYLFNGYSKGERYCSSSGQWTMRQAKKNAKLSKQASVHTLRHAYARQDPSRYQLDNSIGDLFRNHGEEYISIYKPPINHIKLIRAIRVCRTPALGGKRVICKNCGHTKHIHLSCGHSQCPLCQNVKREIWQQKLSDKFLAVRMADHKKTDSRSKKCWWLARHGVGAAHVRLRYEIPYSRACLNYFWWLGC